MPSIRVAGALLASQHRRSRATGLHVGQVVGLASDADDGVHRQVDGLTVTPFDLPDGRLGAYYPEMNQLVPLWYHDKLSKTPAAKDVPVRILA